MNGMNSSCKDVVFGDTALHVSSSHVCRISDRVSIARLCSINDRENMSTEARKGCAEYNRTFLDYVQGQFTGTNGVRDWLCMNATMLCKWMNLYGHFILLEIWTSVGVVNFCITGHIKCWNKSVHSLCLMTSTSSSDRRHPRCCSLNHSHFV